MFKYTGILKEAKKHNTYDEHQYPGGERVGGGPRLDKVAKDKATRSATHQYHPGTPTGQKIRGEFAANKIKINPNMPVITDTTNISLSTDLAGKTKSQRVTHRSVDPSGKTHILKKDNTTTSSGSYSTVKGGVAPSGPTLHYLANRRNSGKLVKHNIKKTGSWFKGAKKTTFANPLKRTKALDAKLKSSPISLQSAHSDIELTAALQAYNKQLMRLLAFTAIGKGKNRYKSSDVKAIVKAVNRTKPNAS